MNKLRGAFKRFATRHVKNRAKLEDICAQDATFWCRNARDLPTSAQLQAALFTHHAGVLLFPQKLRAGEKARCERSIRAAWPDADIGNFIFCWGYERVYFHRVLTREAILQNSAELVQSARDFRALANQLTPQLAATIGVSAAQLSACGQYLPLDPRIEQSGVLNDSWRYFFHGFQCGFTHRASGQVVEVEFGFGEEFGALDPWFWHRFLETTPRYAHLASWLALGYADARRMFDVLIEAELLVAIRGQIVGHERRAFVLHEVI